jgi:hypothetical protein
LVVKIIQPNFKSIFLFANDLLIGDGRDTKALNCKPTTNLQKKYELPNLRKTSGYRQFAVSSFFLLTICMLAMAAIPKH